MKRITLIIFIFVVGIILFVETITNSNNNSTNKTKTGHTVEADSILAQNYIPKSEVVASQ